MRIYILSAKSFIKYFIALAAIAIAVAVLAAGTSSLDALGVFSSNRDLPIYYVDSSDKKAAITFDCAWGADDIPDILAVLKKENIKATFFIVGQWAEKHPDAVKMIADDGHDVANHSYSHLRMASIDKGKVQSEITECGNKLSQITGKKVELFRAPYGEYNDSVVSTARMLGYYTIQWNVDSMDWRPGISQEEIMNRINQKIVPGSIILFHNDTPHTAKILPDIITTLKGKGYNFLPVSQLILREDFSIDAEGRQIKKG